MHGYTSQNRLQGQHKRIRTKLTDHLARRILSVLDEVPEFGMCALLRVPHFVTVVTFLSDDTFCALPPPHQLTEFFWSLPLLFRTAPASGHGPFFADPLP